LRREIAHAPCRDAPAPGVFVLKAQFQKLRRLAPEPSVQGRETPHGPVRAAPENGVIDVVVGEPRIPQVRQDDPAVFGGQGRAGGQNFAHGFRDAPSHVSGILVQVPHAAAHDGPPFFHAGFRKTGHNPAENDHGAPFEQTAARQ